MNEIITANDPLAKFNNVNYNYGDFINYAQLSKNQEFTLEECTTGAINFILYYTNFVNLCLSLFKWVTPKQNEQLNAEFLEKILFYKGKSAFVKSKKMGYMFCDYIVNKTNYNLFNEPIEIICKNPFTGEMIGEFKKDNFVIIKNNPVKVPTNFLAFKFANDIVHLIQAYDNNVNSQKFPIILQGTKEMKTTLQALADNIDRGDKYIYLSKDYNIEDITQLKLNAPWIGKDLLDIIERKKNEFYTLIGLNNTNINKQSGISTDEINANNGVIGMNLNSMLKMRKKSVEEIKDKFNVEISVEVENAIKVNEVVENPEENGKIQKNEVSENE